MEKKKKKFIKPTVSILSAYDVDSDLMYGGGSASGGFVTNSIVPGTGDHSSGISYDGTDTDNSGRAKAVWLEF